MFVILLKYIKPIEAIDHHLLTHRAFLDECYQNAILIASGPQVPRVGGVLLSQLKDRSQLEAILSRDPFSIHQLAEYTIIEFDPIKYHPDFSVFIK